MLKGISSQKLLIAALVCPLVALLVLGSAILAFTPRAEVVEANVWPQSVDLIESLHIEAILSAQAQVADGNASQSDLEDRRARTDDLLERWASIGLDSGQLEVQLDAVRIEDDDRADAESSELLVLADTVRASAQQSSPTVDNVEDLLGAARSDASVAAQGAGVATLTTPAKAQRTRIAGMVALSEMVIDAALPPDSGNLESVLDDTSALHGALIDGEPVTIDQWTDGHIERQRAMAEIARAYAFAGAPVIPGDESFPIIPLAIAAGAGLLGLVIFGAMVFNRLNSGAAVLERRMLAFAKHTLPGAGDSSETLMSDQIEPVVLAGDLRGVSQAFNEVQQTAAYVIDQEREDHEFVTDRVFQSVAHRNRIAIVEQLDILDALAVEENDLGKLEQLAQLDTRMRRMQRDVVSFGALGGESPPMLHEDRALSELIELAVEETRGADRVRIVTVDNVLVDGGCAADVAHIITELLENALHSSPPESLVEVLCNHTDRDSLMVSIADEGHGMDPDEMDGLNQVLSLPSKLRPETAGTLGVVAISAIAARSEIDVRFTDSPAGGVTALVTVPAEMVSTMPDDWTPSTRLATQARLTERRAIAAEIVEARSAAPDPTPLKVDAFDRELPVAEFEYDIDPGADSPGTRSEMHSDGFGLSDDQLADGAESAADLEAFDDVELDRQPAFDDAEVDEEPSIDTPTIEGLDLEGLDLEGSSDEEPARDEPELEHALTADTDVPLALVDYDESPFAAATDDDLSERSGAERLNELNKRPLIAPADGFGPKKRPKNGSSVEEDPVAEAGSEEAFFDEPEDADSDEVESPEDAVEEQLPIDELNDEAAAVDNADATDELDDFDERDERDELDEPYELDELDEFDEPYELDDEDVFADSADVALPISAADDVEPGPTYEAEEREAPLTYAALDSLLANLPERADDRKADTDTAEAAGASVAKLAISRRVPTSSSSISPSKLSGATRRPSSAGPKSPDEVRAMLAKYRSGRND